MHHMDADLEEKLDGNCTRMLRVKLNKFWKQHSSKQQLYRHVPPISKTTQIRRTRHAGHCWRCKNELIRDVLPWTLSYGCANVDQPTRTYLQHPCADTGCSLEDQQEAMDNRDKWTDRQTDR